VHRVRIELDLLGVDHPVLHVLDPELTATTASGLQHREHEIGSDQLAVGAEEPGRLESGLAHARGELEDRVAGPRRELVEHPLADRRGDLLDERLATFPARRDRLPDLVALDALLFSCRHLLVSFLVGLGHREPGLSRERVRQIYYG
jgi:hypothetical protein